MENTLREILKRIEKRKIYVQDDHSSDEEELFSYLTKVKQPDPVCHSSLENQNIAYVDEEETVENDKHNLVLEGKHNEVLIKTENDKVHPVENTVNSQNESSAVVEQNVENNAHLDSKLPSEIKICHEEEQGVGYIEEILDEPIPEKEEIRIQNNKDNDDIERKQCGESSSQSDKYYLINEKDWLSLCARLHNAENVENGDKKTEADEKDSSEKIVLQPNVSSLEEKKSPNTVGKSLFSAFKQYNSPSKTLLKESPGNETTCNSSPQKVSPHKSPKAANMDQGYNSEGQPMSLDGDEQSENRFSITSENQASPKVEIVYIRLEDGHIKYDTSKSPRLPTKYKGDNNLNTVKKLDFSQQNTVHSNENNNAQLASASLAKNSDYECIDLLNDTDTVDSNFDDSNVELVKTANTQDTTKHGMQLRFVRINNKLTRVYERVKHNVIDEVLDASFAYDHNKNEEDLEFSRVPGKEDSGDVVDGNAGNKDSFNFDDSQLIAFPLNAVDPENINIDDSMSMLTPSKLDILNSSNKLDPLTPSKLEFLSQIESCHWTSDKLEWSSPSKLDVNSPGKLDIIPTNEEDSNVKETNSVNVLSSQNQFSSDLSGEKKKTESPIILKVTKSGALVQCNSPLKVENTRNDSLINNEVNRNRSHIQNLWKTFKPGQRKRNKDRSFKEENQQCASESSYNDKAVISGNSLNLKQSQKRLPRKKEDEVPVKKRKVTSDKITEQNEHVEDVQMKSKDSVKKSCLKKGIKLKGSKRKEDASIERNETYIDGTINNVEQSSGQEGQNKINFLEHFFHIKLKEAGIGASCERNSLNKSPSVTPPLKVGKISATYGKPSNKFDNAPEERIFKSNDRNAGGKQEPAGKRSKKKKDTDTSVSLSKNEQVRTVQCRRKTFKQVEDDVKGNTRQVEEYENHSKVQEQSNSITQAVQKSPERTILCRRHKKQNVTSGINMMGMKNHEKDCKLFCEVGSKQNSQTKRAVKKRPKVLTTENELNTCTKQLYEDDDRSDVIGNVGVHNTKKSRVKAKEVKNSKLKQVETDSNRMENGKKNIFANEEENNSQNYSIDIPRNDKVKKGRTKYGCNKKLSVNQTTSKIVQSKNIELETSKSIDELDSSIENENCDTKTKIVTSHDSDITCKEVIESNITDCKRQGTTVSILATFQPFQEEEVIPKDVKTADTSQKSKASGYIGGSPRKSQKKPNKVKHNVFVVKRKNLSQGGDNKVCKRKRKVENDVSDLDTDNEKITTDVLFVGKESQVEKKKVKNTGSACKVLSAKKLRSGKIRLNNTLEQGITPKSVKSPRKPYSRRKLKSGSKKQPKESWKDLLDEADFKFEFSDKANEQHRPINVRHVIRNILKTAQGKEKTGDKKIRHRERKEKSREHSKSSARNSQRLTSESDDAWLSDSGQNVSFPAFKFSSESDSEATKRASKVLANKNAPEILHKPYIDTVKSDEDSEPCGQKYIELHHSPIKVCDSQEIIKVRDSSVESAKDLNSTDSEEQQIDSKGSPDIKKSVDKLRAILDKVSGQEVVKKLKFVDRIGL
ncbi:repetitive organellar protein-like [Ruditapes philippinarum]|uniref:repetitive organellar protein-like n=1 Tax=Ruditapes philippinarum TaxID=129788 RepID=UPI00295B6265|nr:repetitive organellar protein-like [Ruditapes philippinarum]